MEQGKQILIKMIDTAEEKYDVKNNDMARICFGGKTQAELEICKLEFVNQMLDSRISNLNTGTSGPDMKIKELQDMRKELLKNERIFYNTTREEIDESVALVDREINKVQAEISERIELVSFLAKYRKEINLQIKLLKLAV